MSDLGSAASRRRFLAVTGAAVATASPSALRAQTMAPLRVACVTAEAYAEALFAQDAGFYRKHGLDVELVILTSGGAIVNAVAGGSADIGISNPVPLGNAISHGLPFLYIASGGMNVPGTIDLCVASDGPIQSAKDFNGKTLGTTTLKDITTVAILAWIDQNGGDATKVKLIELPFPEMAAAVRRGTVAAAPIAEPLLGAAVRSGGIRALAPHLFSVFGPSFMIGGWFAKTDWIKANPQLVRRFVAAMYATAPWANSHHDETAVILAKYSKQDVNVVRNGVRAEYGTSLTPAMIQRVLDLSFHYKVLETPLQASAMIAKI